jgi:hypothetical protein
MATEMAAFSMPSERPTLVDDDDIACKMNADRLRAEEERAELVVVIGELPAVLLQAIPGFGQVVQAVATANNKRQLNRLATPLEDLGARLDANLTRLASNQQEKSERLADLFEQWAERAQREPRKNKRDRLVQFMARSVIEPVTEENFGERMDFLEVLDHTGRTPS